MLATDGFDLIKRVRQRKGLARIPAIALSGYASQNDVEAAIAAGFDLLLSKPVHPDGLAEAVDSLVSRSVKNSNKELSD